MVDISSQNNKINITVSSSGNTANTNVTPDYAQYYSNKSKEWAISNRIVDNTDYSSKYYANESKTQADISTAKATEVIESGNIAVSNIESARDNAITDITNQESLSVDNVNTAGATQIALATEQATIATSKTTEVVASGNEALNNIDMAKNNAITSITNQETTSKTSLIDEGAIQVGLIQNEGATQVANVQSTGFYMRDDKLYYINSQGEETEFKLDDIELNNPYSLFDSKYSDHELFNLSWLVSNGSYNGSNAVHPSAYQALLVENNAEVTIGSTVTLPNGIKYTKQGLSVKLSTETYTDYDFVLNTADETFRLPLKNHTADDSIEGLTLYFYVGDTVQNAKLIDAGRFGEVLATKTDMLQASGAGMPSDKYIDLTLGASGSTYIAPANGYIYLRCHAQGGIGWFNLYAVYGVSTNIPYAANSGGMAGSIPIIKGQKFGVRYGNIGVDTFSFIYAEGSK